MLKNSIQKFSTKIQPYLKIENLFILIFLVFGSIFIIITPPGQNPDEAAHMFRTWQLASLQLKSSTVTHGKDVLVGGDVPSSLDEFFVLNKLDRALDKDLKFNDLNHVVINSLHTNDITTFRDFRGAALYSPVAYTPTILATWLGLLFNLPVVVLFYLMRIFCLLSVSALLFFAIRTTPIGKWIFFGVCLVPSVVAQAAAISTDGIVIGTCILFTAYVLKLALDTKDITWKHLLGLFILVFAIATGKITYLPLAGIALLIPILNYRIRNKRCIFIGLVALAIAIIPGIIWSISTASANSNYGVGVNVELQKIFVFQHPITYLKIVYYTFFTEQNSGTTPFVWLGFFGNFGYLTAPLPVVYIFGSITALVVSVFVKDNNEVDLQKSTKMFAAYRSVLILAFGLTSIAIATALYLYFSHLRATTISGLQGRYFIPIAPLLLLFFYGTNSLSQQKKAKYYIVAMTIFVLLGGCIAAYYRYYR